MLALLLMLLPSYYAQNHTGIIGSSLGKAKCYIFVTKHSIVFHTYVRGDSTSVLINVIYCTLLIHKFFDNKINKDPPIESTYNKIIMYIIFNYVV